jgi:RHS repeat-associated protein
VRRHSSLAVTRLLIAAVFLAGFPTRGLAQNHTLMVLTGGTSTGTVSASTGGGAFVQICPQSGSAICSTAFPAGQTVTLRAAPPTGASFSGWDAGGLCSGTGDCVLALASPTTVVARFARSTTDTVGYYHLDPAGSVRAVTDGNGQVQARFDYLPFGEKIPASTATDNPRMYAGKERDSESGFDYFGGRYYTGQIGRFTTVDPLVPIEAAQLNPQMWNSYAYVMNNPLRYSDPDGRCPFGCVGEGYGAYVIGAAAAGTAIYLTSPQGRAAVSQVVNDTRTMITTAAGQISSWFQSAKRPGTHGKPDHKATVEFWAGKYPNTGTEVRFPVKPGGPVPQGAGGKKDHRRADVVIYDPTGAIEKIIQIIRPTPGGHAPVREEDAKNDLEHSLDVPVEFKPVDPTLVPDPPKDPSLEENQ